MLWKLLLLLSPLAWATVTPNTATITTIYKPVSTVTTTITVANAKPKQEIFADDSLIMDLAAAVTTTQESATTIAGGIFFINAVQVFGTAAFKQIFDALNGAQIAEITTVDYNSVQYTDTCAQLITSIYT